MVLRIFLAVALIWGSACPSFSYAATQTKQSKKYAKAALLNASLQTISKGKTALEEDGKFLTENLPATVSEQNAVNAYMHARKLYQAAQSEYNSWLQVLATDIKDDLPLAPNYATAAERAQHNVDEFSKYVDTVVTDIKTGKLKAANGTVSNILDAMATPAKGPTGIVKIGIDLYHAIKGEQAKQRAALADDLLTTYRVKAWEDLLPSAQKAAPVAAQASPVSDGETTSASSSAAASSAPSSGSSTATAPSSSTNSMGAMPDNTAGSANSAATPDNSTGQSNSTPSPQTNSQGSTYPK